MAAPPDAGEDILLERWRRDTPLVATGRVHLNNAGASPMPRPVVDRVVEHLRLEAEMGGYEAAAACAEEIASVRAEVARLVGVRERNVALVENTTAGYAQALSAFDFGPGDVIVTTRNDYVSNQLMFLSLVRRRGVKVQRAEDLPGGGVAQPSWRSPWCRPAPVWCSPVRQWGSSAPRMVSPTSWTRARRWVRSWSTPESCAATFCARARGSSCADRAASAS
jgi:hypothetical protein